MSCDAMNWMEWKSNSELRQSFLNKLFDRCPNCADLGQSEQFVYILNAEESMSLTWLGRLIYSLS